VNPVDSLFCDLFGNMSWF